MEEALYHFQWDDNKYLPTYPLSQIVEIITTVCVPAPYALSHSFHWICSQVVSKIDEDMKNRAAEFSVTKSAMTALNRRNR